MPRKGKEAAAEGVVVTAQQSRFAKDSLELDAPTTHEILIKDLTVSVDQRELLAHAELFLKAGGHYTLVGRNGTGKSSMPD